MAALTLQSVSGPITVRPVIPQVYLELYGCEPYSFYCSFLFHPHPIFPIPERRLHERGALPDDRQELSMNTQEKYRKYVNTACVKAVEPIVITQAKGHATITAQTIAALSEHGRVAQSFIADRVPYAVAMTGGRTAPELGPKSAAAEEVAALWRDLKSCFHEKLKVEKPVRSVVNG